MRSKREPRPGAQLSVADVRYVNFSHATLNRASLRYAWATNVFFGNAHLQGASFDFAQLQGASFDSAQLQGASLESAQLQGASFDGAQLQGASLEFAQLQGASFSDGAQLQGASLKFAHLQGASLDYAHLQGASLSSLRAAQVVQAFQRKIQLQGDSFKGVCAWRADAQWAEWKDTRFAQPETGPKAVKDRACDWTEADFAKTAHRQGGS
jgi:hypothetical protein